MTLKLYHAIISVCAQKVRVLLAEHSACSVLTFALAFRPAMRAIDALQREALLGPHPNQDKADKKRDVTEHGLESKYVAEALADYDGLLEEMEAGLERGPFLAGETCSLADVAVIPYVIRLDMLRLAALWADRPRLAGWYRRMNARSSVQKEIWRRFSQCDIAAFAAFQPEPWPRVREILALG